MDNDICGIGIPDTVVHIKAIHVKRKVDSSFMIQAEISPKSFNYQLGKTERVHKITAYALSLAMGASCRLLASFVHFVDAPGYVICFLLSTDPFRISFESSVRVSRLNSERFERPGRLALRPAD